MRGLSQLAPRSVRAKPLATILPVVALAIGGLTLTAVQRVTSAQEQAGYDTAAELARTAETLQQLAARFTLA